MTVPGWLVVAVMLAQQGVVLEGTVTMAETGEPVAGALVVLVELDRSARTDEAGKFRITEVAPGRRTLRVEGRGLEPRNVSVLVPSSGTISVNVQMTAAPAGLRLLGRVVDASNDAPIAGAMVRILDGPGTQTNGSGEFQLRVPDPGEVSIRVWAYGHGSVTRDVRPSAVSEPLVFRLPVLPVDMAPLSVRARSRSGTEAERALFEREPRPGVVGISAEEIEAVPVMLVEDVVRSLQALPGVVQLNDLSARLHVRGGGPDQNLFLLDGARVFAPYHMFGIFGAFNNDAVSRVEFYRGDIAARHGGALSSVVEVVQRDDAESYLEGTASLGMLAAGGTLRGRLPIVNGSWMVAGRRSTIAQHVTRKLWWDRDEPFPFEFHDIQARIGIQPTPKHRITGSWFSSADRFRMFLENAPGSLQSNWGNRVGALRWDWDLFGGWSTKVGVWRSEYDMSLAAGAGEDRPTSRNAVALTGYRLEAVGRGVTGVRLGLEVLEGDVALRGGERPGGYVEGTHVSPYDAVAAYLEAERTLGPLRLAPSVRVEQVGAERSWAIAPRLAARLEVTDQLAITLGAGRTHQDLSTLRDDRYVLPGPPFWFVHPEQAPVSVAEGVSGAIEGWIGRAWSYSASVYGRRFRDLPAWRPVGDRQLDDIQWDDGRAWGTELVVRRHAEDLHGWVSYGFSNTLFEEETGREYRPVWDRRHAVDAAVFWRLGRLDLGTRAVFGTGTPLWAPSGNLQARWIGPVTGTIENRGTFPVWTDQQLRYPTYFRVDATARVDFEFLGADITPYAGLLNLLSRRNVVYYEVVRVDKGIELRPNSGVALTRIPSLGVEVSF